MSGIDVALAKKMPKKEKRETTTAEENFLLLLLLHKEMHPNTNITDTTGSVSNELPNLFEKLKEKSYFAGEQFTDKGRGKLAIILTKMSEHNRHQRPSKPSYPWHDN